MNITRPSHSTFIIQTRNSEDTEIVFDPVVEHDKIVIPRSKSGVYLSSTPHSLPVKILPEAKAIAIDSCGEYEFKGVFVFGVPAVDVGHEADSIAYLVESEGIHICLLGAFQQKELTTAQLDQLGSVDILVIPVGKNALSVAEAEKIIEQIEPRMILLSSRVAKVGDEERELTKKLGLKSETMEKLKISKKDLSQEETKLIVLEEK